MKKAISLILLGTLLSATACAGEDNSTDTTVPGTSSADTTAASGYDYPDVNYNGYEFRVLNFDDYIGYHISLDFAEQTGETLDDAIYNRNRSVEEKLGFKLVEVEYPFKNNWVTDQTALIDLVRKSALTDSDDYDAAYLNLGFNPGIMSEAALLDLNLIDTLNLEAEWWDQTVNDAIEINGKLYGASSPLNLITSDHAWSLLFNQDMMDDLGLEYPYDLVREGKWTLDKMNEYVSAGSQLNSDESFTWDENGTSVYGLTAHQDSSPRAILYAAGNRDVSYENGRFTLTLGDEHYFNSVEKLLALFNINEGHSHCNTSQTKKGYAQVFANDRAMFISAHIYMAVQQREMNSTFGLVPNPKYDENQDDYYSLIDGRTALLCVPANAKELDRTGIILDALSYESMVAVLPKYYEVTVSQKGLRNQDSIEMMEIVRNTRGFDIGWMYLLTSDITDKITKLVVSGTGEPASIVASNRSAVEAKITTTLETIGK